MASEVKTLVEQQVEELVPLALFETVLMRLSL
jgi:hypothetical protein